MMKAIIATAFAAATIAGALAQDGGSGAALPDGVPDLGAPAAVSMSWAETPSEDLADVVFERGEPKDDPLAGLNDEARLAAAATARRRLELLIAAAEAERRRGGARAIEADRFLRATRAAGAEAATPRMIDADSVYSAWLREALPGEIRSPSADARSGPRVSFGRYTRLGELRAVAAIVDEGGQIVCTGTLIGRDVVLTAAHCFCGDPPRRAIVGEQTSDPIWSAAIDEARVSEHVVLRNGGATRRECEASTKGRDIAVLRLTADVAENVTPQVGRLVSAQAERSARNGDTLYVSGFGRTEIGESGRKAFTTTPIVNKGCARSSGPTGSTATGCRPGREFVSQLVARNENDRPSAGPCKGDSGGPAFVVEDDRWVVFGIVSRTPEYWNETRCGDVAIYTALNERIRSWIGDACGALARSC